METFEFTINQKVTVWQEVTVSVKAESKSDAIEIVKDFTQHEYDCSFVDNPKFENSVEVLGTEYSVDIQEPITKKQNNNLPVREIYDDEYNSIDLR